MTIAARMLFRYSDWFASIWFVVLTYLSLAPLTELPLEHADKLLHVIAYAALAFFGLVRRRSIAMAIGLMIAMILYGGLIEMVQPSVNRYGEIGDFIANSIGAVLGALIAWGLLKLKFIRAK